ncbi:STAS domain-containing protein [Crossiella sp. CA198]|uniref:STAS domain-containing protein n=1 Tax=Crossiella sp. CA198 TaxID=3455607 RepID=UPI003F8D1EEE
MTAAPPDLQLDVVRIGRTTTLFVHGELDLAAAPELRRMLAGCVRAGGQLVVDLRQATFVDCAAIGVLLTARRRQLILGGGLRCAQSRGLVRRVLQLTGAGAELGC